MIATISRIVGVVHFFHFCRRAGQWSANSDKVLRAPFTPPFYLGQTEWG